MSFALAVFAQVVPPSPENLGDFAKVLLGAVMGGQWSVVVALVLAGVVWGVRKLAPRWAFFATDEGAFSLNLASSFLLAMATALFAGGWPAVTGAVLLKAIEVSFLAAGGWAALTKFLLPMLGRLPFLAKLAPPKSAVVAPVAVAPVKAPTALDVANKP